MAKLCAFSSVSPEVRESLRFFLLKSYNSMHQLVSLQLNVAIAAFTQVQDEVADWAECGSEAAFYLQVHAPETWALLEVMVASLVFPVEKTCVELINLISSTYAASATPTILPFAPETNLIHVAFDQAALLKRRTDEIATLALMNQAPPKRPRDENHSSEGRRGRDPRTESPSHHRSRSSRGGRGKGHRQGHHQNRSYTRNTTEATGDTTEAPEP